MAFNIGTSVKNRNKIKEIVRFISRTQMLSVIWESKQVMTLHKDDSRDFGVNAVENKIKM